MKEPFNTGIQCSILRLFCQNFIIEKSMSKSEYILCMSLSCLAKVLANIWNFSWKCFVLVSSMNWNWCYKCTVTGWPNRGPAFYSLCSTIWGRQYDQSSGISAKVFFSVSRGTVSHYAKEARGFTQEVLHCKRHAKGASWPGYSFFWATCWLTSSEWRRLA